MRQTLFVNSPEPRTDFTPITGKVKDLSDLAKKVIEKADTKEYIIFIDIYLEVVGFDVDDMKGIELLKWLRLKGLTNHIVLYGSILSAEELIRFDPTYATVASQGSTVIQDYDFYNTKIEYNVLFPENAKEYLTPFIKAEFTMPEDERHNWANWWGIKKLFDVYNADNLTPKSYHSKVEIKLRELNSNQAIYLYEPQNNKDVIKTEKSKHKSKEKQRTDLIKRKKKILYIDDQAADGWANIFCFMFYESNKNKDFIVYSPQNLKTIEIVQEAISIIESEKPDLVLLDLRLKNEMGVRPDIKNLSGAIVLGEIRKIYLGLPIIMVTASNKARSMEELEKLGCDAFWIKEGLDSNMSLAGSVENYYKLIYLVERTTGEEYQFLKRLGEKVKEFQDVNNSYWWENHTWERKEGVLIFDKEGSGKITLNPDNGSTLKINNTQCSITDWGMGRKTVNYKNSDFNFKVYSDTQNYKIILWADYVKCTYTITYPKSDILNHFYTSIDLFKRLFKSEILELKNNTNLEVSFLTNAFLIEVGKIIEEFHREANDKYFDTKIGCGIWFGMLNTKDMYANEGDFVGGSLFLVRNSISHRATKAGAKVNLSISDLILVYCCFTIWLCEKKFPKIDSSKILHWNTDAKINSINQLKTIISLNKTFLNQVENLFGKKI